MPYSPLGRGLLTGTITSEDALEENDSRRTAYFPRFQGDALDANLALVAKDPRARGGDGLHPRAAGAGLGARAGRGTARRGPIPGTKRIPYLEENVGAADVVLSEADLDALEEAVPREAVAGPRYGDMSSIDD